MKFDPSIVQANIPSPLGNITLAATAQGLAGLWFEGQRHLPPELVTHQAAKPSFQSNLHRQFTDDATLAASPAALPSEGLERAEAVSSSPPIWPNAPDHPVLQQARQQLAEYFAGQRRHFELPLDLSGGTAFQQAVWQALLAVAPGGTVSYGEISQRIGKPGAVRAVGAAIGRNPVSIVVPCHRVLGADGSLTGYAGGLARKTALLRLEGALLEELV
jgi:methylated-DNA-[protein]-cysteine S-methyltransferase